MLPSWPGFRPGENWIGHRKGARASTENALLIAQKPSKEGSKRNNYYHYDVVFDGEVIVRDAWEPCCEASRVLRNRGITGSITFLDSETLKPRLTIPDIERGAGLTVKETPRLGFAKWQPFHLGANHE